MTDDTVHPDSGADDDAKIWAELEAADAAQAAEADAAPAADPAPVADSPAAAEGADAPETPPADKAAGDTPAGTAAAAPAAPDIWANATPEQRAAYDATRKELDETNQRYRRVSGTVSGLQRKLDGLTAGTAKAPAKPGEAPKSPKAPASIFDDPDLKKVEAEYPEVIGPLKKVFADLGQRTDAIARQLDGMSADARGRHIDEQVAYVLQEHKDYGQIKGSAAFRDWFASAPAFVQDGVKRNAKEIVDGYEVAAIVSLFKQQTGTASPAAATPSPAAAPAPGAQKPAAQSDKRKAQLESAAAPRGRGPAPHTGTPESDEDWWAHYEEQDRRAARR